MAGLKITTKQSARGIVRLTTFRQLETYIATFAGEHLNLLIRVGAPQIAKSRTDRRLLDDGACWIEGNVTHNQTCTNMQTCANMNNLMIEVRVWLNKRTRTLQQQYAGQAA